jgi:hypothetical protein
MRNSVLALASLLVATALLGGIAAGASAPTREEYVARAEPICKAGGEAVEPILKGLAKKLEQPHLAPAGRALSKAAKLLVKQRTQVLALPKPSEDAATLTSWLKQLKVENTLMERAGKLMLEERKSQVQGYLARFAHAGNVANDIVLGFGFNHCLFRLAKLPKP